MDCLAPGTWEAWSWPAWAGQVGSARTHTLPPWWQLVSWAAPNTNTGTNTSENTNTSTNTSENTNTSSPYHHTSTLVSVHEQLHLSGFSIEFSFWFSLQTIFIFNVQISNILDRQNITASSPSQLYVLWLRAHYLYSCLNVAKRPFRSWFVYLLADNNQPLYNFGANAADRPECILPTPRHCIIWSAF